MSQVTRPSEREYEFKFLFHSSARPFIESYFEALLMPDEYPLSRNYTVNFDDLSLSSVLEKLDSLATKRKVRLRWYQDPSSERFSDQVFLEVKDRYASSRAKRRELTGYRGAALAKELESGSFSGVFGGRHFHEADGLVEDRRLPVTMSSYNRKRFICRTSGARVNIDYDLTIGAVNSSCFPMLHWPSVSPEAPLVVELKTKESKIPPELLPLLNGGARSSFSKYHYMIEHLVRPDRSEVCEDECL